MFRCAPCKPSSCSRALEKLLLPLRATSIVLATTRRDIKRATARPLGLIVFDAIPRLLSEGLLFVDLALYLLLHCFKILNLLFGSALADDA
jgi:hypothetical protein